MEFFLFFKRISAISVEILLKYPLDPAGGHVDIIGCVPIFHRDSSDSD